MEIVLGIDNIVFLSIITDRLPEDKQPQARTLGLFLALAMRIALLLAIKWVMGLKDNLFFVLDEGISGRDLILGAGGLFLLGKATVEIFENIELRDTDEHGKKKKAELTMASALVQIILLDIVFSLDSVITAVGMADSVLIMILAMVAAMVTMLVFAKSVSDFINKHPSMKILGLSFLLLIGVLLVAESLDQHVNKGYIYFAMAFSLIVELINMRVRKKSTVGHELA
ncbi:MAG: TerC family protein [Deltaproteobacteria bacterium]|nr:TerC family protein [Deltaproteobacteria bacterium]